MRFPCPDVPAARADPSPERSVQPAHGPLVAKSSIAVPFCVPHRSTYNHLPKRKIFNLAGIAFFSKTERVTYMTLVRGVAESDIPS